MLQKLTDMSFQNDIGKAIRIIWKIRRPFGGYDLFSAEIYGNWISGGLLRGKYNSFILKLQAAT